MYLNNYLKSVPEAKRTPGGIAFFAQLDQVALVLPEIAERIIQELKDQRSHLKLIASENYSSLSVQQAMGTLLTDKYAEGIPGSRFYGGCENVDAVEALAVSELKKLFGAEHAYVQPHSGADANLVAFWAILVHRVQNPALTKFHGKTLDQLTAEEYETIRQLLVNQKVMGMGLSSGGHLTHGYRHNLSSKMMMASSYDVDSKTGLLDYEMVQKRVLEEKPLILIAGYSAYSRKINFAKMRKIADSVGAALMVDMAHFSGLVAGKVFTGEYDPVPYADVVTSTTHKTLRGPRGGIILCKAEYREVIDKGCPLALGGPLPHVMAAKAIAFKEASTPAFRAYAAQVVKNAQILAERFNSLGVKVITGGTENHMVIIDVDSSFRLTGRQAERALGMAGVTINRNTIPADPHGPWYTSGARIGTPAMTTLGMKEKEMEEIAEIIYEVLSQTKSASDHNRAKVEVEEGVLEKVKGRVNALLSRFPLYPEIVV